MHVAGALSAQYASSMAPRRGDYGFDAPYVIVFFAIALLIALGIAIAGVWAGKIWWIAIAGLNVLWFGSSIASFVYTTRIGKLAVWDELLASHPWRGDERVLDVGCGRGAVLTLAAARVPQGSAIGVDLWSTKDQSGNAAEVTLRNAELEGVRDRVEIRTGDMRKLPCEDASFDVIVSSMAIHNVPDASGRAQALDEIARVLKPDGVALIADISRSAEYVAHWQSRGLEVERRSLGWRFWYGGPHVATYLVRMRKGGR